MVKGMRAYKLAEELGLSREDLIKKAAEIGIEIRNPMATIDEDQANTIRRKLSAAADVETVQKRVGTGVIRRRKRKTEAEPEEAGAAESEQEHAQIESEPPALAAEPVPSADGELDLPAAPDDRGCATARSVEGQRAGRWRARLARAHSGHDAGAGGRRSDARTGAGPQRGGGGAGRATRRTDGGSARHRA